MVFRQESAAEFFKDLVESALVHQRVNAAESTAFYVVHLLTGFMSRSADNDDGPLGLKLVAALESGGEAQRTALKQVGDMSLFVSGFFSDSLRRKLVDVGYYIMIGGHAYTALSRRASRTCSPVFAELAEKFPAFVDVLSEVSERTACTSNADLLRLYEKWLRTRSQRSGQLLVERGVVPIASAHHTTIH